MRVIKAKKEAQDALRESEARLWAIFDYAPVGISLTDLEGRYLQTNQALQQFLGYTSEELQSMTFKEVTLPEDLPAYMALREQLIGGQYRHYSLEKRYLRRDGDIVWAWLMGVSLNDAQGKPQYLISVYVDITKRKTQEQHHLLAQKMEAVGRLAGGIAHDFNNILTVILGNIGLAILNGKPDPQVQERLAQAEQACLQAKALSQQLLTFAQGGTPIKKVISISRILKKTVGLTLSGSKSQCEISIPEDLWSVEADEGQIIQVFNNLLINADQAMPRGGIIRLGAENVLGKLEADLPSPNGKYVKLTFADQGMNISPKHLNKIYEPYFSTKQIDSGLGLAIAYSIIKNHSGLIKVQSHQEVGTIFTVYLPAQEATTFDAEQEKSGSFKGKGRVLVLDDEIMVREIVKGMLDYLGYETDLASDGSQAIEKYLQAKAEGRPFAVVILDLTIPGGMGGREAIKELLKINPQVKAIVSSGYSDDSIMSDFQKYGFSGVIAKPYRVSDLGQILHKVINIP